ncbi:hypothetical protein BDR06DRAFT_1023463 [Suillus hirtellus]|nr:hypothetical protein BDR06DRAFT_1023463 [Suillus hirtellus]
MLIDIKATLIMLSVVNRMSLLVEIKALTESKYFKSGLQNCLTACVLSPNLTAYVNDMLEHVMEFTKNNNEILEVPKFLFEDIELTAQLLKLISKALSCICSNVKTEDLHIKVDDANQVHKSGIDSMEGNEGTADNMEGGDKDDRDDNQDNLEDNMSGITELDPDDLGFRKNEKHTIFTSTIFWKLVDAFSS